MNYKNSMNHEQSDEMRELVLEYMTAFNESDHEKAEELLRRIDVMRNLLEKVHAKDSKSI